MMVCVRSVAVADLVVVVVAHWSRCTATDGRLEVNV